MIARLYRMLPVLVILAAVAGIVYLVALFRYSSERAKEILIKLFLVLTGALSAFFALASLYALFEGNFDVLDLVASFLAAALLALAVTLICRAVFRKNHPHYRKKAEKASGFRWFRLKK